MRNKNINGNKFESWGYDISPVIYSSSSVAFNEVSLCAY